MSTTSDVKNEATVTLDEVVNDFKTWRANKANPAVPIPDDLWLKVFALAEQHSASAVRSLFGLTIRQYNDKYAELCKPSSAVVATSAESTEPPTLCEVNVKEVEVLPYEPSALPLSTKTVVVEFCRADGQIMKIHTTTDRFEDLLRAFFPGESHDSSHAQA